MIGPIQDQPFFSIIIPVYNVGDLLRECLDNVIKQSFIDFEIILINDGSTDKSGNICNEYREKDKRISVIHKQNGGVSSARNEGLKKSVGKWILFLDSDDFYATYSALEIIYNQINSNINGVDLLFFNLYPSKNRDSRIVDWQIKMNCQYWESIENINPFKDQFYICRYVFLRSKIKEHSLLFDESIIVHEDFLFVNQYLLSVSRVIYINEYLYFYFIREGSALQSYNKKYIDDIVYVTSKLINIVKNHNQNQNKWTYQLSSIIHKRHNDIIYFLAQPSYCIHFNYYLQLVYQYYPEYLTRKCRIKLYLKFFGLTVHAHIYALLISIKRSLVR